MQYKIEDFIREFAKLEKECSVGKALQIARARNITQQTMHDVFYIPGEPGIYVKLAKRVDGISDTREMEIEHNWYLLFTQELGIPEAPKSTIFQIGDNSVLGVEEVRGETYDSILRLHPNELEKLLEISASISARGYDLHLRQPDKTPTYFREFNGSEYDFLVKRASRILAGEGFRTEHIDEIIQSLKPRLTEPRRRLFYRDAIPQNWIRTERGNIVPIDLGSTSYRPPQFELVALLETPDSGLDNLDEVTRDGAIRSYQKNLKKYVEVEDVEEFIETYYLASLVKNYSGIASRIQHISTARKVLADPVIDEATRSINQGRLIKNIEGRIFHAKRALTALRTSKVLSSQRESEQYSSIVTLLSSQL